MSFLDDQIAAMRQSLARAEAMQAEHAAIAPAPLPSIREQVAAQMPQAAQAAVSPLAQVAAATMPTEVVAMRALMGELQAVFKRALTPEQYASMATHVNDGAPGIMPFLKSDTLLAFATMLHDEYVAFLATPPK
jgi:hypothetical protein